MTYDLWDIRPQIHILTNYITVNDVVNACLSVGATAIGGDALYECAQITEHCDGLLINTGTPSPERLKVFLSSGKRANELDIPVVLDPVGASATDFRRDLLKELLKEVHFTCIRGNASEIKTLCEMTGIVKAQNEEKVFSGVEEGGDHLLKSEMLGLSKAAGAVIVASGSRVLIADAASDMFFEFPGGSSMQKLFTGAGCMMSAIIASYLGAARKEGETGDYVNATRAAVALYQINAARAELFCRKEKKLGTISYKNALMDLLSLTRLSRRERLSSLDTFLYAITNREILKDGTKLTDAVEQAILGGATMIQLREKNMSTTEYIKTAIAVNQICECYDIPLIINDNVEVCRVVGAAGVHLGLEDESVEKARQILGRDYIIGATAHNIEEAQRALLQGADYLGVGAAFGSDTKKDAKPIMSLETYREITSGVPIPVVAIGGITSDNLHHLSGLGLSGIAVISSIFGALDIKENTKSLKERAKEEILK